MNPQLISLIGEFYKSGRKQFIHHPSELDSTVVMDRVAGHIAWNIQFTNPKDGVTRSTKQYVVVVDNAAAAHCMMHALDEACVGADCDSAMDRVTIATPDVEVVFDPETPVELVILTKRATTVPLTRIRNALHALVVSLANDVVYDTELLSNFMNVATLLGQKPVAGTD